MREARSLLRDPARVVTSGYQALLQAVPLPSRRATPFVIVGPGRSGTTLVQAFLDSHPNCVCMHELWQEGHTKWRGYYGPFRVRWAKLAFDERIERALQARQPPWIHAIGCKLLHGQPKDLVERQTAWTRVLSMPALRIVRVKRNLRDSTLSAAIARVTESWTRQRTRAGVVLDPGSVARIYALKKAQEAETDERLGDRPIFTLHFDDLVAHSSAALAAVLDHLDLPRADLPLPLQRQNDRPFSEVVGNWREIEPVFGQE